MRFLVSITLELEGTTDRNVADLARTLEDPEVLERLARVVEETLDLELDNPTHGVDVQDMEKMG